MKAQTKWGWLLAIYLFLAGLGGGAYTAGVLGDFLGWHIGISKIGILLGFPSVLLGTIFLIADLGKPKNFWRAFMKPGTSWIARGTIIISIFMIVNFIHIGLWIWPFNLLEDSVTARYFINIVGVIFAFGTMIYTGVLLGASRPIAFWSTAMLPLLFLVSALSTGFMAVILLSTFAEIGMVDIITLEKLDIKLIIGEIFILVLYLYSTQRVPESRASSRLILRGTVAPLFWIGVALLGLIAPLVLNLLGIFEFTDAATHTLIIIASICGIIGGLILRKVILAGGIHAPLIAGRFEYGLTNV
ncbi:MAG: polysulfide reductase NrfD [Candidatus Brocadiales bacterium]|nr:polysulfide reductase NrfD [Candidatus Brocadiales bacterium]